MECIQPAVRCTEMERGNEREDALHLCLHLFIDTCRMGKREGGSKRGRGRERGRRKLRAQPENDAYWALVVEVEICVRWQRKHGA